MQTYVTSQNKVHAKHKWAVVAAVLRVCIRSGKTRETEKEVSKEAADTATKTRAPSPGEETDFGHRADWKGAWNKDATNKDTSSDPLLLPAFRR